MIEYSDFFYSKFVTTKLKLVCSFRNDYVLAFINYNKRRALVLIGVNENRLTVAFVK